MSADATTQTAMSAEATTKLRETLVQRWTNRACQRHLVFCEPCGRSRASKESLPNCLHGLQTFLERNMTSTPSSHK